MAVTTSMPIQVPINVNARRYLRVMPSDQLHHTLVAMGRQGTGAQLGQYLLEQREAIAGILESGSLTPEDRLQYTGAMGALREIAALLIQSKDLPRTPPPA